ncbi:ATP-binding protein [Streptomyces kanasensis]|uniref:ATP-binding protein n=1 Tax=Streptomyces kanasensis TaxID=936756 RepID=UPI0037F48AFA
MDPMNPLPDDRDHDPADDGARKGGDAARPRASRDDLPAPLAAGKGPAPARTAQLVTGDLLLTVNPVDGSEIERCPPGRRPEPPARRTPEERAERDRAAAPPVPAGPADPLPPLLERDEQRERLVRLLSRGRSVRLTGPAGSGRSRLLDAVAADCADLAPDGVIRLSGHRRTSADVLYDLFAAVHHTPGHRPDRAGLLALVREIGAVVLVDDLEFGGAALDDLLDAAPECAFLLAATPDTPAPSPDAAVEEVFLTGLDRSTTLELLEHVVDRPLTDDEANWAGDLWFESEGLPLRFVQAAALLRQRDTLRTPPSGDADDAGDSVFTDLHDHPLPSLAEAAAPAALLASRLSEAARDTLRFAVALGGELPHQAHLPALVGDTHADAALGELVRCGLLTPVGPRHRLAAGITEQLVEHGYGEGALTRAHTAAQHYAWWAGHPSVAPERVAAEADAVLAALQVLSSSQEAGHASAAVLLARSAAPALAAALHWGAWERALRSGQAAARLAGEVAEEAYFHHELGVLALCQGNLDRARAALEASIGLRGALADKRGTVAGRRALALVADRERGIGESRTAAGEPPAARQGEPPAPFAGAFGPGPGRAAPATGAADGGTGSGRPGPAPGAGAVAGAAGDSTGDGGTGTAGAAGAAGLGAAGAAGRPFGTGAGSLGAAGVASGASGTGTGGGATSAAADFDAAFGEGPGSGTAFGTGTGRTAAAGSAHGAVAGSGTAGTYAYDPRQARPVRKGLRGTLLSGARRNLVAAASGALLAAVLGTVVTLGATSGDGTGGGGSPGGKVTTEQSAGDGATGGTGVDDSDGQTPDDGTTGGSGGGTGGGSTAVPGGGEPSSSARPGATGPTGSTGDPSTPGTDPSEPGGGPTGGGTGPSTGGTSSSPGTSGSPTTGGPTTTSPGPSGSTTTTPEPTDTATDPGPTETATDPATTGGAAGGTTGGDGGGDSSGGDSGGGASSTATGPGTPTDTGTATGTAGTAA